MPSLNFPEGLLETHTIWSKVFAIFNASNPFLFIRLSYIRDLSRAQSLVSVILKLLEYCVKVKAVRQYLHKPSVNAMKIMLATLNIALKLERDYGSASGGAAIAERVLKIMEIILHEATAYADIKQVSLFG